MKLKYFLLSKKLQKATSAIIEEFEIQYKFDSSDITYGNVAALRVFKSGVESCPRNFSRGPFITILNEIILEKLKELPLHKIKQIVEKANAAVRIM